jgi:hypothetical protein
MTSDNHVQCFMCEFVVPTPNRSGEIKPITYDYCGKTGRSMDRGKEHGQYTPKWCPLLKQ